MITYVKGDLLTDSAEALVNAVNTVGVMGKGLAYQFKEHYPVNFLQYRDACKNNELSTGKVYIVRDTSNGTEKYIVNFPTKAHWRGKSKIEYIEEGLEDLVSQVLTLKIRSVAIPALGSGLGGLPWSLVEKHLLDKLGKVPSVEWRIYAPTDAPPVESALQLTPARSAMLILIDTYLRTSKKKQASVQEVQSLVYLLQQRDMLKQIPYEGYRETPFSSVLYDSLKKMDGHCLYLSGINKGLDKTFITLDKDYLGKAKLMTKGDNNLTKQICDVMNLISGYQSNEGMAIISTVLWVCLKNEAEDQNVSPSQFINLAWDLLAKQKGAKEALVKGAFVRLTEEHWLPSSIKF
ncbi:TPA: macro domain-containing protein [Vibrio vulnificus]